MDGGIDQQASPRSRALMVAGTFAALVAGVIGLQRLADSDEAADDAVGIAGTSDVSGRIADPSELSFETPEEALDNFLAAFESGEFELAVDMLSGETRGALTTFEATGFTTLPEEEQYPALDFSGISDAWFRPSHIGGELLELASLSGSLPIDLAGGVDERVVTTDGDSATIEGRLANDLDVTVHLRRSNGRAWRVDQIVTPGGDPDAVPFSAAPGNEPPARTPDEIFRYADRFPMDDPEAFAVASLQIVEDDDFFSLDRITGQQAWTSVSVAVTGFDIRPLAAPPARSLLDDIDDFVAYFNQWGGGMPRLWAEADALGGMYVDPVGPYVVGDTELHPTIEQYRTVTITDANDVTYRVTVIDVDEKGWRLHQILAEGGDPDLVPLSGPTGVEILPGTEQCWDHVRFDCDATFPAESVPEIAAMLDDARASADAATASADLRALEIELIPDLDQMCATMQGLRSDLAFPQSWVDLAPVIVEDHCPGDPSLLRVDPDR